jgi:hypothetical protein
MLKKGLTEKSSTRHKKCMLKKGLTEKSSTRHKKWMVKKSFTKKLKKVQLDSCDYIKAYGKKKFHQKIIFFSILLALDVLCQLRQWNF